MELDSWPMKLELTLMLKSEPKLEADDGAVAVTKLTDG